MGFNDAGIERLEDLWPDADALSCAGTHIGQEDIRRGGHLLGDFLALGRARVDRHGPLVSVQVEEVGTTDGTRHVAIEGFELDDVSTQISKQPASGRTSNEVRDLQHSDAFERRGKRGWLLWLAGRWRGEGCQVLSPTT